MNNNSRLGDSGNDTNVKSCRTVLFFQEVKEKPKRKDRIDDESKDVLGSKWDIGMSLCMYVKRN